MFWSKSRRPTSRSLQQRLRGIFAEATEHDRFSFAWLEHVLRPASPEELARSLTVLMNDHIIDKVVRVESRAGGGIGPEYESVIDVPTTLYDRNTDSWIEVEPADIRVEFARHSDTRNFAVAGHE